MITLLRIRGLALLEDVTLELGPGMTVLTGETGAGKSIVVDALTLLRGARGGAELVRAGRDQAAVDAQFVPPASTRTRLAHLLEHHGLPPLENGALLLGRRVGGGGRTRCLVQGEPTTQQVLTALGGELLDVCSQHEHHSLAQESRHLALLDDWAGLAQAVEELGARVRRLRQDETELASQRRLLEQRLSRIDLLRFQIDELREFAPRPGEHGALAERVALLREADAFDSLVRELGELLQDGPGAVLERLLVGTERARRAAEKSASARSLHEHLDAARAACEEALGELRRLGRTLERSPEALEALEARLGELVQLGRKHGASPDSLPEVLTRLTAELEELQGLDDVVEQRSAQVSRERTECLETARSLSRARREAAQGLAAAALAELRGLHLEHARLEVRLEAFPEEQLGPRGLDRAELLFSANPGEPLAPLSRVASGGELSRVLLAIKSALAVEDRVATYVFDEVDAGVGGAVATAIAERLRRAATAHQVLCITHLPQVAAYADSHLLVEKKVVAGRTSTRVRALSPEERVEELARMLGGAKVTSTAREHARALLEEGRQPPGTSAQSRRRAVRSETRRRR